MFKMTVETKEQDGPMGPSARVKVQNPAAKLDHAKREIVAARFFYIPV